MGAIYWHDSAETLDFIVRYHQKPYYVLLVAKMMAASMNASIRVAVQVEFPGHGVRIYVYMTV
jgi:hypothetical protein